ncbi:DUF3822 family protein [Mucilaginibacter daejeonensis]|uniref:DUF3822 family protein n=1 Tax=Mucilaginibacter daejeonensis TaxID=398049 RepID=UPI001D179AD1|nr:DUF3822 family protein [Mucilaginibacter daejeonensis]UEG52746.1 DUF3822 family protein [Mucilaginibacter daejeonensis]
MNDALYHYIDPSFSHLEVGHYTLTLLLGEQRFSLSVLYGQQLMVWRKDAPIAELTSPGEVQEVLNFGYQDVITAVRSANFTLVPQIVFEEDGITEIARFLDVHATDTVMAQPLDDNNEVVFKITQTQAEALNRFGTARTLFGAKGWLKAIASAQPSGDELYVNICDGQFDIAYFQNSSLQLFNTFEFGHEDELAYYAAFICQQLKLDMSKVTLILSGMIAEGNQRYTDLLSTMFKSVQLNTITVANIPDRFAKHQLLAITSLPLCASLADA